MVSSIFLVFSLLNGMAFGSAILERAQCNANNCLRVMTNTPVAASSFCSTYLQPTQTVTVTPIATVGGGSTVVNPPPPTTTAPAVVPEHISSQCLLSQATTTPLASRLSSACSCLSITPATGTATTTSYLPARTIYASCPDLPTTYTSGGDQFTVYCGYNLWSNYINYYVYTSSMAACIDICATTSGCVGVNWSDTGLEYEGQPSFCSILSSATGGSHVGSGTAFFSNYTLPADAFTNVHW